MMSAQYPLSERPRMSARPAFRVDPIRGTVWFEPQDGNGERFCLDSLNQCLRKKVPNGSDRHLVARAQNARRASASHRARRPLGDAR